jgi:hypothetical protein
VRSCERHVGAPVLHGWCDLCCRRRLRSGLAVASLGIRVVHVFHPASWSTSVLPQPTSPYRSRFIGIGEVIMSWATSLQALIWSWVSVNANPASNWTCRWSSGGHRSRSVVNRVVCSLTRSEFRIPCGGGELRAECHCGHSDSFTHTVHANGRVWQCLHNAHGLHAYTTCVPSCTCASIFFCPSKYLF